MGTKTEIYNVRESFQPETSKEKTHVPQAPPWRRRRSYLRRPCRHRRPCGQRADLCPVALSAETGSSTGLGLVGAALSLGISLAFWGTVYNALVSRGTIPGQIIPQLPIL